MKTILAKLLVKGTKRVNRVLLGKLVGGLPLTSIRSLEEVLYRKSIQDHVLDVKTVYEPLIVKYQFAPEFPLQFRREKVFEKKSLFHLRNVCLSPRSGLVWLKDGYVLEESVGSLIRLMGWGGVLYEPLLAPKALPHTGPYLICPPTGFFHWLFEVLPNFLHSIEFSPDARILLPENCPKYVHDSLDLLFGSKNAAERVDHAPGPVSLRSLVMPQVEVFSGFVDPRDVEKLRTSFKRQSSTKASSNEGLYYITRKQNHKRRMNNESEMEDQLVQIGFRVVDPERMLFRDQIALFSTARMIVGPHGAGLGNMVWADTPCVILEIFPHLLFNDCYARLSSTLDFEYDYSVCDADKLTSGKIPVKSVIEKVSSKLQKLGL